MDLSVTRYNYIKNIGKGGKMLVTVILSVCLLVSVNGQRIAGGDPIEIQKYPFAAALLTNGGQGSYSHGCGGTIVTATAILSAASCFYNSSDSSPHEASWWRVRVGSSYSNTSGTIYFVSSIIPNPDFSPETLANDLAVLRTTMPMWLVPGSVAVARIAGAAYTFTVNQRVLAIGWGATSNQESSLSPELREVQIWTIDQTTCTNRWNTLGITVTPNMVCAGWLDVGVRGQCPGDAGSPLLEETEGFVVGVFSRSNGCGQGLYPDINTRITPYVQWIISAATQ